MPVNIRQVAQVARKAAALVGIACLAGLMTASDHADVGPLFGNAQRFDANITQFYAFRAPAPNDDKLVLILVLNSGITDPGYFFAEDLTLRFHIDNHSEVTFGDGDPSSTIDDWMMRFGGAVTDVDHINHDVVFEVTFEPTEDGRTSPRLSVDGLPARVTRDIRMFPAPGESPLRLGSAVVVLEVPLELVVDREHENQPFEETLLLWATSSIPEIHGPLSDHIGMPNTSNQPNNILVNVFRPRDQSPFIIQHPSDLIDLPGNPVSLAPYADVLIYHLSRPTRPFPPGRGNPNLPPPPGFVPFDPFNRTGFPNGRPVDANVANVPFDFPYIRP